MRNIDVIIKNGEELEEYINENRDLIYPDNNIRIEFQTNESQINDIDCKDLFLCKFEHGAVSERFDFVGRDVRCWGDCILRDFLGRCFDGGNFVGRDFDGRNAIMWNFEGRNVVYYAVFVAYHYLRCASLFGRVEHSIHKCLNERIEYIAEKDFQYGVYSFY